jgi:hypothetical protein
MFMKDVFSEAAESTRREGLDMMESVQKVQLGFGNYRKSEAELMNHLCRLQYSQNPFGPVMENVNNQFDEQVTITQEKILCMINYCDVLSVYFKLLFSLAMVFVSVSERTFGGYKLFVEDNKIFLDECGYICPKKLNNQEIHQEGKDYRAFIYSIFSIGTEDGSEAEVSPHRELFNLKLMIIMKLGESCMKENCDDLKLCSKFLMETQLYNVMLRKFHQARVFSWLLFLLLSNVVIFILFRVAVQNNVGSVKDVFGIGGGSKSLVFNHVEVVFGMNLVSFMPFRLNLEYVEFFDSVIIWFTPCSSRSYIFSYPR